MSHSTEPAIVIATLLHEQGPTGVQTHFNAFRRYMESADNRVEVITPYDAHKVLVYPVFALRRLIDPLSGTLSVWWYRYWHALFLQWALRKRLVKMDACVIYAQCPLAARAALRARFFRGQRVNMVVHFNKSQAEEWSEKGKISADGRMARCIRALEARTLAALDGIVYVSRFMQDMLEASVPLLKQVRNAVIPNFCAPARRSNEPMAPVDIINIGTLEPRKNQQFLLQVLAEAALRGRHYTLALVGDGPDRPMLEQLAERLGLGDQVRFMGYQLQAGRLMPAAKVYAHSATVENLPLAIIEAMSCGLPILAPPVGGIPDLFVDAAQGYFWDTNNVQTAAALLIHLLDTPDLRERLGVSAQARFEAQFSAGLVAARLHRFLLNAEC